MPESRSMVDVYPLTIADPDFQFQLLINAELRNAQRVQAAFEKAFPPGRSMEEQMLRIRNQPKAETLFPRLCTDAKREEWLLPILRRLAWNLRSGAPGAPWLANLSAMTEVILSPLRKVSEAEFLALAGQAESLVTLRCSGCLESLARFVRHLEKGSPLSGMVVGALRNLMAVGAQAHGTSYRQELFVWPFFRAETSFDAEDQCWSARVRRDLAARDSKSRPTWMRLFDAETGSLARAGKLSKMSLAAVEEIGRVQLEGALRQWIGMLRNETAVTLTAVDTLVFRHVILLCKVLDAGSCGELLYDIALVSWWGRRDEVRWLGTYLWVLEQQSQDRAFACLEALMMNPVTAAEEVRRKYQALLTVFNAEALPAARARAE